MKFQSTLRRISLYVAFALVFTAFGGMSMIAYAETVPQTAPMTIQEVVKLCRPAVVQVIVNGQTWDPSSRQASSQTLGYGSGDYILPADEGDGGYVLTNYHVVTDGDSYDLLWYNPETDAYDITMEDVELVGYDNGTDIAVLKFTEAVPAGIEPLKLGDSETLELGDTAIVIGHPGASESSMYGSVTSGIISGMQREDINAGNFSRSTALLQVDAAINSGNSGGALLNDKGELVGIPTLKYAAAEGMGFCIPISTVKDYITEIIQTGSVARPRLGVSVQNFDGPDEPMKSYPPCGVMIMAVEEESPAEKAGLLMYDIITEVNGIRVMTFDELTEQLDQFKAGDTVTLKVYRYYDSTGARINPYEELDVECGLEILD